MDGVTLGLIIVIFFIIITLQPFGKRANSIIVGALGALAMMILWQSDLRETTERTSNPLNVANVVASNDVANDVVVYGAGTVRTIVKTVLRNAKNALVAGAAGIAAVGSFGAGGDTIVEILALTLDAGMYVGELAMIFLEDTSEFGHVLKKIWNINFRRGVDGVRDEMIRIYDAAGDSVKRMAAYIREIVMGVVDWLLGLFGRVLSALIPDDASVVGWILSESLIGAIRIAANNVFWILNSAYNNVVPSAVHAIVQHPEKMKDAIINVIELIRKYLMSKDDDTWAQWAMKHAARQGVTNIAAAGTMLLGLIILPIVFIPVGAVIAIGGSIMNVALSAGIGREEMDSILQALYTREFNVPGVGLMTAVDALVMLIDKAIPLTFAAMFVISDYSTVVNTEMTKVDVEIAQPQMREQIGDVAPKIETKYVATATLDQRDLSKISAMMKDLPTEYAEKYDSAMEGKESLDDVLEKARSAASPESPTPPNRDSDAEKASSVA